MGSLLIPFPMLFLPSFPDSLNSPAHDQQSKPLLQNNYILQRELFHYSKLYWRKMYSHLNFNRFPFILTRDNQFFNWGHYRAKCPLGPWCGSTELRDVQMGFVSTFRESLSSSLVDLQHLTQCLIQRKNLTNANWDEMNEELNIPFALNERFDEIKRKKVSWLANSPCVVPTNQ